MRANKASFRALNHGSSMTFGSQLYTVTTINSIPGEVVVENGKGRKWSTLIHYSFNAALNQSTLTLKARVFRHDSEILAALTRPMNDYRNCSTSHLQEIEPHQVVFFTSCRENTTGCSCFLYVATLSEF